MSTPPDHGVGLDRSPGRPRLPGALRRLLEPPVREGHAETTRVARTLHVILLVSVATVLFFAPLRAILVPAAAGLSLAVNAALLTLLVALFALARRGHVRLAGGLLVGLVCAYATVCLWLFGGVRNAVLGAFLLVTLTASMLFGYRAAIGTAAFGFAASLAAVLAEQAGLLPLSPLPTPGEVWIVFVASLVLLVCLLYLATAELQRTNRTLLEEVDERRRVGERLRESEARFRSIIDSSPMGVHLYRLEDNGRLVLTGLNPASERMLGARASEYVGKTLEEAFPGLAATGMPTRYRRVCSEGTPWNAEEVVYEDERIRGTYEVHAFQTAPGMMATMFLDITERKRAHEAHRDLEERLRQSQKMEAVGRLAGGVAHEFNNLLMVIMGHGELLRRGLDPTSPQTRTLHHIMSASERAARLVRQLLAFGRKQVLEPQLVDLNGLVGETARMLRPLLGEDIRLVTRLDPSLGRVRVDPAQIDQVLMNLAVNGRDAMPAGRYVVLSVVDTGAGMDEETRAHLFEPFFTTKLSGAGTGLGLAMVYGIVQQSGGHITVESAPGQGSSFRIFLPRADEERATPVPGADVAAVLSGSETVLVVEDEPSIRDLAREFLEGLGYSVLCAAGGEEALSLAARLEGPIHLLLADVAMPGMSGPTLAERLLVFRPRTRVLYMSAYAGAELANRGLAEEAAHFLPKPFTQEVLGRRVRRALDRPA